MSLSPTSLFFIFLIFYILKKVNAYCIWQHRIKASRLMAQMILIILKLFFITNCPSLYFNVKLAFFTSYDYLIAIL